jgi:filamentous hemagglutinin family protein
MRLGLAVLALTGGVPLGAAPTGSVVLDGSYGTSGALTGPNYQVTAGMGLLKGNNLFQSFSTFNLVNGESATFSGPANVQNILARVTGGGASSIDGTINSSILGANLFLLNPAGVMFGPNAQVNVTGAFMVGTPNYVKLSDGGMFYTSLGGNDNLTSAPVSAFGFMPGATPQPVTFTGSQLTMAPSTGLHVIAGDITLTSAAYLLAPGGNLTFFSAAGSGEVPFSLTPTPTQYFTSATTVTKRGNITLNQNSQAEIDGNGGGSIVIRGGKLTVVGTNGAVVSTGGGITTTTNSNFTSGNFANIPGGNIYMDIDDLTVSKGAYIGAEDFGGADTGSISIQVAKRLSISDTGSQISTLAELGGNAGDVSVSADAIDMNGGDIFANADLNSLGHAGDVTVSANSLSMEGNSRISSFTGGSGNAGTVRLSLTGSLTMKDTSGIVGDTYAPGHGGILVVSAPQIAMYDGASITANSALLSPSSQVGDGGNVTVTANSLSMQGSSSSEFSYISANTVTLFAANAPLGTGNAGEVTINAGVLSLNNYAEISSASFYNGGNGGSVTINSSDMNLDGGSIISASSTFTSAGIVDIKVADSFQLRGGSSVTTSAAEDGGDINFSVGKLVYLIDSNIQAYAGVPTQGATVSPNLHGGNIYIDPQFVALGGSYISANDLSPGGTDGNITNLADFFFSSDSILHATGTIQTTPPDLDLGESLVALPANLDSAASQLRERCEQAVNHEFSTFIVVGRGGIEPAPGELQSDFGLSSN